MDRSQRVGAKRLKRRREQKKEKLSPKRKGQGANFCPGPRQKRDTDLPTGAKFRADKSTTKGMRACVAASEKLGYI